jgi:hypothetical protein
LFAVTCAVSRKIKTISLNLEVLSSVSRAELSAETRCGKRVRVAAVIEDAGGVTGSTEDFRAKDQKISSCY